jgi:hypothetical protein
LRPMPQRGILFTILFARIVCKTRDLFDKTLADVIIPVLNALYVTPLSVNQVNFIEDYCSVMQLLTCALDILWEEQNIYIGHLLPTLVSLEKLKMLKPTLKYAGPLVDAVLAGIDKRFSRFFDCNDLIVVSIT